jgi:phenylacetate-CoA ligase
MGRLIPYSALKQLYQSSPGWLQRAYASIPFPIRAGRIYRQTLRDIEASEFLPAAALTQLQEERLARLFRHARASVPFYRAAFDRLGPSRVSRSPLDALRDLPLIAKADLRGLRDEFISRDWTIGAAFKVNTGGSTGTPLAFFKNNALYPIELAHVAMQWRRVGYAPGDPKITLRGQTFANRPVDRRWQYNPIYNELVLSSYHLDAETLSQSLREIARFRPQFLHGYPSAIMTFLKVASENGLPLPDSVEAILCASEPLFDFQRAYMQRVLQCAVFSFYGQTEGAVLAGECEHSPEYHFCPTYGILELVDDAGQPITTPGIEGEIVGTSLNNVAMPFIRYRTGDRGILAAGSTCVCGRSFPRLSRVTGRTQSVVVTRTGTRVSVTALIFGQHFQAFERILGMQLVQETAGELMLRIVRSPAFSERDEAELQTKIEGCVDGALRVLFHYCQRLPASANGKTPFVIQAPELSETRPPLFAPREQRGQEAPSTADRRAA